MNIDPKIGLIIGVAVSIEQAIGIGAVNLTDAIPLAYIPIVKSWCMILAFIGTVVLTALHGNSMTDTSRLASAATLSRPERAAALAAIVGFAKLAAVVAR